MNTKTKNKLRYRKIIKGVLSALRAVNRYRIKKYGPEVAWK